MKLARSLSILALTFCAFQSSTMAQTAPASSNWYAGGSVGSSGIKLRTENINTALIGQQDTSDTGYKVFGGYQFNPYLAAEIQYYNLGKYHYTDSVKGGQATVKTHGFALSAVGSLPIMQDLSLLGKVGVARQTYSGEATSGTSQLSRKASKANLVLGVGAEYQINTGLRLRAEYEYFGVPTVLSSGNQSIKLRTDLLSVGLRYQF